MADNFLPFARQSITEADATEVSKALTEDIISRGPKVEQFEQTLSTYCGARYGVAFNSATTALQAACYAAEVSQYDSLITSPNTFVATVGGGILAGANPIFIDIDANTGNFSLDQIDTALNQPLSRGRPVVMPVHFAGQPVDMQRLERMVRNPDTVIIEDAAWALGSSYSDGQKVGSCAYSHMTVFSFHPAKNITTGEGGMVMTNDAALCHRLRLFRNNGIERDPQRMQMEGPWYYEVHDITGNFNFTDFQAALGLSQLKRLEVMISKRQQIMDWYRQRLREVPHLRLLPTNQVCIALIDFETCGKSRIQVVDQLRNEGIGTHLHYIPLYRHPYFSRRCGDLTAYFPEMERYYSQTLTMPLYVDLTENDVDRICNTLMRVLRG